jgi:putative redox protein
MKATATRTGGFKHSVWVRSHHLNADEPKEHGGDDSGPSPQELLAASLASCTAVTMEMYARRKGWDIGDIEVIAEYQPGERGSVTRFNLVLKMPKDLDPQQVEKLKIIAAKCPVHRTLDGEVMFDETIELV